MRSVLRRLIKGAFRRFGYDLVRRDAPLHPEFPPDTSRWERDTFAAVKPFTMTSVERVTTLVRAVRHVVTASLPGDVVECGVWRGGSSMAIALTLVAIGDTSRHLYLFDTFAGMPPPSPQDVTMDGLDAASMLEQRADYPLVVAHASLAEVRTNLASTGYPMDKVHFVEGRVEDTIPGGAPRQIALLRLDTDWYDSTRHELAHLYPRVVPQGITIIDDYGHWQGAKAATDEYFASLGAVPFLNRVDYTARLLIKL